MEHIISVLVENKFGVLSRVANLFSGRGYNIETLSVAPTLDPSMSMMTIVTRGDDKIIEQIVKQLNKVIDVIKVVDLNESEFVEPTTYTIEVTGDVRKVEACINLLQPLGLKDLVRTGRVAIAREPVRQAAVQPKRILKEEK